DCGLVIPSGRCRRNAEEVDSCSGIGVGQRRRAMSIQGTSSAIGEKRSASSPPGKVKHFTPEEREARGKAARAEIPRRAHGEWEPARDRPDPVDLLEEQSRTRVSELVPIRYGRMLVSPFTFYRGAAALMASDLAAGPRTGLHVQLCGDAHLSNF